MLLQALYEYAEKNNLIGGDAFEEQNVRWIIPLDKEGCLRGSGIIELADIDNKKGKLFSCPKTLRRKNAGGVAEYLVDNITSVFGIDSEPLKTEKYTEKKRNTSIDNNVSKCKDFWEQIENAYEITKFELLKSMLIWRAQVLTEEGILKPEFIRYGISADSNEKQKPKYWLTLASGQETAMKPGDRFTFEVDNNVVLNDIVLMDYWRDAFKQEKASSEEASGRGVCLITGMSDVPIQKSHPVVKVPGGLSTGSYLISFSASKKGDVCSFVSYGKVKGENAPISTQGATAYFLALNKFLNDKNHNIRVGSIKMCFWAKERDDFSDWITSVIDKPYPKNIRKFFDKWLSGVPAEDIEHDRFYTVALSGNAGRVVVKHWIDQPLFKAVDNMKKWFDDLDLTHIPRKKEEKTPFLSFFRLAITTVRDSKDLQSGMINQLLCSALEGKKPSLMFLKPLLHRFKCDLVKGDNPFNPSRFALLKLILIRNRKENDFMPDIELCDTNDIPYNLGCLLAVLENVQNRAHDYKLKGAGVVDRYYGTASSSPALVFPLLLRLVRHHKRKIESSSSRNAGWVDKEIGNILAKIQPDGEGKSPQFPKTLTLEQQGRFALGFYQQKVASFKSSKKE